MTTTSSTSADGTAQTATIYNAFGQVLESIGPRTVDGESQGSRTSYDRFGQALVSSRLLGDGEEHVLDTPRS